jgi:hypothetical protein
MQKMCPKCRQVKEFYSKQSKCRECSNAISKEWYKNNKDRAKKRHKEWREKNREHCRQRAKEYIKGYRRKVLDTYGRKCVCCGETNEKFLSLDHKNNDGYKDRKKHGTGAMYQLCIKRGFPSSYQILCYNCNMARAIYGECPHKGENQ